ncbi:hypothetical protein GALMADRAFT_269593 [Galerina marginata CBS 339.88]|uniref:G domain-containing protein n=1 Tax=Galerina marginata (strain CBS 339.88) TaxID=685588 RepID=A0A067T506_GALM3|nr:hypothetical protein GALMADRAFT_269593 [Galerina marginata CBS 339.88]
MQYEDLENPGLLDKDDIVIAIMGPTGVGKSNIIDKLTGQDKRVGHSLKSCTSAVGAVRIRGHPKYDDRIVVVDTPGFDDTEKTDQEILQTIAEWLVTTHKAGVFLHGIVYVQRITDVRMPGAHHRNLLMCAELCGKQAAKKVLFVTTRWDDIEEFDTRDCGIGRESELKTNYWTNLGLGDSCERFYNTSGSAWNIINSLLLRPVEHIALQLQVEMGDPNRALETTKAAHAVHTPLPIPPTKMDQGRNDTSKKRMETTKAAPAHHTSLPITLTKMEQAKSDTSRNRMQLTRKKGRKGVHYTGVVNRDMNSDIDQVRDGDIIILVMGPVGAGKSTFINALLGEERMEVGHSFSACTTEIQVAILDSFYGQNNFPGCRLVIVEMPGFNDTSQEDVVILKKIADWVSRARQQQIVLGGVVYLYDISTRRFSGAARRNLSLFDLMFKDSAFAKVIIGTTKWGRVRATDAAMIEDELVKQYWADLVKKGASVCRFQRDHESAWSFAELILQTTRIQKWLAVQSIRIQTELTVQSKLQKTPEPELDLSTWRQFLSRLVFSTRKDK